MFSRSLLENLKRLFRPSDSEFFQTLHYLPKVAHITTTRHMSPLLQGHMSYQYFRRSVVFSSNTAYVTPLTVTYALYLLCSDCDIRLSYSE